ncbi:CPBP family intramembrane glutamic endopeptidase [Niallia sp. XMNu-256]|uniref:CPBP family intramembrane glutamic endopeptidase n=1 Tax=Niallia sp. XMNu-256 TaxID=3082444 RepID=UPI0030D1FA1E
MKKKYSELMLEVTDKELLKSLYLTQLFLLILSLILGFFLFDDVREFAALFKWDINQIFLWGGSAGVAVFLLDYLLMKLLPSHYYDDGGLNERIFQTRPVVEIAMISGIVSIAEEILFRGVIQTHVGLILSSLIFAFVHFRYLFNKFLFINVIGLSFLIGFIYDRTENLLVTILMHFMIDFLLGCLIKYNFIQSKKQNEQEGIIE